MNMSDNRFDNLVVVKRSGQRINFNAPKIALAIKNAFDSIENNYNEKDINKIYEKVLNYIAQNYQDRKTINVEVIQNIIEDILKENKYTDVYYSFSEYRSKRAESRKAFSLKQEHKLVKIIEKLSNLDNFIDNNETPEEILLEFGKTIASELTKTYILDNKYISAHEEGSIYIHNLDYLMTGMFSDVHLDLSKKGFDNLQSILKKLFLVSKECYGEISLSSIEQLIKPYVINYFNDKYKEFLFKYLKLNGVIDYIDLVKLERKIDEINKIDFDLQIFEEFILNQNIYELFLNAQVDAKVDLNQMLFYFFKDFLLELDELDKKYSISLGCNYDEASFLIANILLDVISILDNLTNVTLVYRLKKDLKCNVLTKITSLINSGKNIALTFTDTTYNKNLKETIEYFSNGKRIFENVISKQNKSTGRMVIATTSINLAKIAFNNKNKKDFYNNLDDILDLTKNQLISIFEYISNKNKENYKVLFHDTLMDDEKLFLNQKVRKIIKNGTLNIGLVGLKECSHIITNSEDFIIEVLKYINKKVDQFSEEFKLNFVISETNDDNVLLEFMRLDKAIYGILKNVTDKEKYTTLSEVLYNNQIDFKNIGQFTKYLTGGHNLTLSVYKKTTEKQILDLLNQIALNDIGFIKIKKEKKNENS